jgi:cysteine-rich repeat protein
MNVSTQRESYGHHAHLARCFQALLLAAGLAAPLAWPHPARGGATAQPEALFHLAQCNDGTPAQPVQWDCEQFSNENPLCGTQVVTAIRSSQVLASLKGRLTVRVDDAACSGDPTQQTRLSLRIKPPGGAEFSLLDRDLNFCGGVPLCGGCDSDANCCDLSCSFDCDPFNTHCCLPGSSCNVAPGSCPLDPMFLCAFGDPTWDECVLQGFNQSGAQFDTWLDSYQLIPPSMTAEIAAQLPSLPAGAVPVIVASDEVSSGFVNGLPDDACFPPLSPSNGPSTREFCLKIWVITLPDPGRTTQLNFTGSTDTSSLTDMGTCGCGDGLVDLDEECDDANTAPGDGCDASCRREACWTCSGEPSFCFQPPPRTSCRQPTEPMKALLKIKDKAKDKGDSLKWKWTKGQATTDFGDPLNTDAYDLCIYHDSGAQPLLAGVRAPAGGTCDGKPCWSAKRGGVFKYKNKTGVPSGLTKLVLKPGTDGKAKVGAKAKGTELTLPMLPLPTPVLVQLHRVAEGQTDCWEATYSNPDANESGKFKAKAD